jgi:hypothetical protein
MQDIIGYGLVVCGVLCVVGLFTTLLMIVRDMEKGVNK